MTNTNQSFDLSRFVFTPSTLRSLADRSYERRKAAALEVENLLRDLYSHANTQQQQQQISTTTTSTTASSSVDKQQQQSSSNQQSALSQQVFDHTIQLLSQLIKDFAYHSTQVNAKKGGLIALAASSIALTQAQQQYNKSLCLLIQTI
jgi:hypothetical protein